MVRGGRSRHAAGTWRDWPSIITGAFIVWYRSGWLIRVGGAFNLVPIALGLVAMAGGILAIRCRAWGLALAGAACAIYPPHPWQDFAWTPVLGIAAVVLVVLSRHEFSSPVSTTP